MKLITFAFLILFPISFYGQLISVKTLPVSTGDQFLLFPSQNLSMGKVSIALNDSWLDPFTNPAKGSRILNNSVFVHPTFYNISGNLGSAWTLPTTAFLKKDDWYSVISAAFQQLEGANVNTNTPWFSSRQIEQQDRFTNNKYIFISVGRKLPAQGWAFGGSLFWADLNSIGGVDLLYNQSVDIKQKGDLLELRGGTLFENEFSTFEAIILYNNFDMIHEVKYIDWLWNEFSNSTNEELRVEKNLDHTRTWGAHFAYNEKVNDNGMQIGAFTTFNWKTHPKIPNYEIMNIPRDPGNTWAFNIGIGISNEDDNTTIGFDFIYEPIWSNTWADAVEEIDLGNGRKILPGQKTIENDFTFHNWIARFGFNKVHSVFDISAGLEFYKRNYNLEQFNYVTSNNRSQEEDWLELTWSWGLGLHFKHFYLKYSGHLISGTGVPGVEGGITFIGTAELSATSDIIAAPSGILTLDDQTTSTHQFVIQIPLDSE